MPHSLRSHNFLNLTDFSRDDVMSNWDGDTEAPFLKGLSEIRVYEDAAIVHDTTVFGKWKGLGPSVVGVVMGSEAALVERHAIPGANDAPLKRTLFACDELAGFVSACGFVRPDGIATLEPKSVRKKLKQPSFASGVHREDVYEGAELLAIDLDEHIANVIEALRPIAAELGLRTAADAPA